MVKNSPANAGDLRDPGSIPGSGKSPWRRAHGTHSNVLETGAWWATVHDLQSDTTEASQHTVHTSYL